MAWKQRGSTKFYYRSVRRGDRVASEYLGNGESARWWAESVAELKGVRERKRKLIRKIRASWLELEKPVKELCTVLDGLAGLVLIASGCRKLNRVWRRRRDMQALNGPLPPAPKPGAETDTLLARAAKGDETCYREVCALLEDGERGQVLVDFFGNMVNYARNKLIKQAARGDLFVEEAMFQRLEHVRRCFAGPNPTPSEDVLAARIALCEFCGLQAMRYPQAGAP